MRGMILGIAACAAACGAGVGNADTVDAGGDDDVAPDIDAPVDAEVLGAFGTPQKIAVAALANLQEDDGTLSYSGLELVFAVQNAGDNNRKDLFYTSRATPTAAFDPPTLLPFSAVGTAEETPRF